jgi:hypothetical protein
MFFRGRFFHGKFDKISILSEIFLTELYMAKYDELPVYKAKYDIRSSRHS